MSTRILDVDATPDIEGLDNNVPGLVGGPEGFDQMILDSNGQPMKFQDYYQELIGLSDVGIPKPQDTLEVTLEGTEFGTLLGLSDPSNGLASLTVTMAGEGITSNLSYASRHPVLPKRETILPNASPRILYGRLGGRP
jgi:hypothetical protein